LQDCNKIVATAMIEILVIVFIHLNLM